MPRYQETPLDQHAARAGWDVYFFGIPLILLLIVGFFRLDEVFTKKKDGEPVSRRLPPVMPEKTRITGSDPDGRSWDED